MLTKSIAALIPGVGLVIYLLLMHRWRRPLQRPGYVIGAVIVAVVAAGFYMVRERLAPGYLAAAWGNDVSNRFLSPLDQHGGPPWYYVRASLFILLSIGPLVLLTPLALLRIGGKARLALIFCLCIGVGELVVVSLSSTKLPQYVLPAMPWLTAAGAIAVWAGFRMIRTRPDGRALGMGAAVLLAGVLFAISLRAAEFRLEFLKRSYLQQALYGELFQSLDRQGVTRVTVVDRGIDDIGVAKGYAPQLRFYSLLWAGRGLKVERAPPYGAGALSPGSLVASCDGPAARRLMVQAPDIAGLPGCAAILAP